MHILKYIELNTELENRTTESKCSKQQHSRILQKTIILGQRQTAVVTTFLRAKRFRLP